MSIETFMQTGDVTIESGEALVHQLKTLIESEGWRVYRSIVEKQQTMRFDRIVLNPLDSVDAALGQEYMKGEIQGMRMAVSLPEALIEGILEQVRTLREQREAEESAGKGDQQ